MLLWDKGKKTNDFIACFTVGNDFFLDQKLAGYDCIASIAHAATLQKAGILSKREFKKLKAELKKIILLWKKQKFAVLPKQEDCHTAIEEHLTKKLGELGKKIHAGRSRNDQCIAMLRLYSKQKIFELEKESLELCGQIVSFAEKNEFVAMPGYTHSRKAMASSIGLWALSNSEALLDSIKLLEATIEIIDQCPLGAAAGFGSILNLDRKFTAKILGFKKPQKNVLYVQSSRGKFEAAIISALCQIMLDLNKVANDLIVFSMEEFGFFELPEEICTGSSIMPQKKNPDVLELIRAKSKKTQAALQLVLSISSSTNNSYNRDLQLTKVPLMESLEEAIDSVKAMQIVFKKIKANKQKCLLACSKEIFSADIALQSAIKGMPFRTAYKQVSASIQSLPQTETIQNIKSKKSIGMPGNLGIKKTKKEIIAMKKSIGKKQVLFFKAIKKLCQ